MTKNILNSEDFKKLRNVEKMNNVNDGTRSLYESVMAPEVISALEDWKKYNDSDCILIGGMALSYYIKPRYTQDVDVIFLSKKDIPKEVYNFKRHRDGAFQHNKTHVEIEVLTPESINTPLILVQKIFNTAIIDDESGLKIASPEGIIALKLGRFKLQDQADIEALKTYKNIDLSYFDLSDELIKRFDSIKID